VDDEGELGGCGAISVVWLQVRLISLLLLLWWCRRAWGLPSGAAACSDMGATITIASR
jgi:hypothetical protein